MHLKYNPVHVCWKEASSLVTQFLPVRIRDFSQMYDRESKFSSLCMESTCEKDLHIFRLGTDNIKTQGAMNMDSGSHIQHEPRVEKEMGRKLATPQ